MIDLGCGPGNSTELLAERWPDAAARGLDSSADMIAAARVRLPGAQFEQGDIASWSDSGFDVILSNAALHWLHDHVHLFPRLVAALAPGGSLAVQMPDNLDQPSHVLMREIAADAMWPGLAEAADARGEVLTPAAYYALLKPHCARVDVWRTTYHHVLDGPRAVVEWFKGSALRPYLARLDGAGQTAFLDRYTEAVTQAYPAHDGAVLLPFPRLFIVATR